MSTRCQIEFKTIHSYKQKNGKIKQREESRMIYRHSDGYPEGVIPDLKDFLEWNNGRNGDLEYMSANFVYWSKRWHEQNYYHGAYGGGVDNEGKKLPWHKKPQDMNSTLLIGFGISGKDGFHGDEEYFYEVIVELGESIIARDKRIIIKSYKTDYTRDMKRENFELLDTVIVKEEEEK